MAICGGTGIATENKKNVFFSSFGGDVWQYVAVPASPRKTKKVTFLKHFSLGGDVWQYVAVPVSPRKTNKVTFFKLFSFGGDVWQYVAVPVSPRKQKSDFL